MKLPFAYVITTRQTPKRAEMAKAYFDSLGIDYQLWYGFHGESLGIRNQNEFPGSSETALFLNHLAALQAAYQRGDSEVLILEDDCYFIDNYEEEYRKSHDALPPDWQMVYLHALTHNDLSTVNDRVVRGCGACTHAILYKREAIPQILELLDCIDMPVDLAIREKIAIPNRLAIYSFSPGIARQHSRDTAWNTSLSGDDNYQQYTKLTVTPPHLRATAITGHAIIHHNDRLRCIYCTDNNMFMGEILDDFHFAAPLIAANTPDNLPLNQPQFFIHHGRLCIGFTLGMGGTNTAAILDVEAKQIRGIQHSLHSSSRWVYFEDEEQLYCLANEGVLKINEDSTAEKILDCSKPIGSSNLVKHNGLFYGVSKGLKIFHFDPKNPNQITYHKPLVYANFQADSLAIKDSNWLISGVVRGNATLLQIPIDNR